MYSKAVSAVSNNAYGKTFMRLGILGTTRHLRPQYTHTPTSVPSSYPTASNLTSKFFQASNDFFWKFPYNLSNSVQQCTGSLIFSTHSVLCHEHRSGVDHVFFNLTGVTLRQVLNSTSSFWKETHISCSPAVATSLYATDITHVPKVFRVSSNKHIDGQAVHVLQVKPSALDALEDVVNSSLGAFLFIRGAAVGFNQTVQLYPARLDGSQTISPRLCSRDLRVLNWTSLIDTTCPSSAVVEITHTSAWNVVDISGILQCQRSSSRNFSLAILMLKSSHDERNSRSLDRTTTVIPETASDWYSSGSSDNSPKVTIFAK